MLSALKKGDRVVTSGGIYGTVQGVESETVYLKIAENVKVKVARSAISGLVAGESESQG
jgi:preprotein translocase subunit YajC